MRLGVLAASVARVIEHRCRRRSAAKWEIVADVNPTSPGISLALGEDRYGGVIAVQSIGCEDMRFNAPEERFQHRAAGPHLVGQGRKRSISNRASMRRTASRASGEIAPGGLPCALRRAFSARSAMAKNGRRAWTQQAASRIGPGL